MPFAGDHTVVILDTLRPGNASDLVPTPLPGRLAFSPPPGGSARCWSPWPHPNGLRGHALLHLGMFGLQRSLLVPNSLFHSRQLPLLTEQLSKA